MNNLSSKFATEDKNTLFSYIESLNPETIAQLHSPSPEVAKLIERRLVEMLGILPSEDFDVSIETSRGNLGQLMASAMMYGYFLHNAQERMTLEQSWENVEE